MDYYIVKLGGALVSSENPLFEVDTVRSYVQEIKAIFADQEDLRLILVVGGGYLSRKYRDYAKACGQVNDTELHKVGMNAIWLNAEVVRGLVGPLAFRSVLGHGVYASDRKAAEDRVASDFQEWLSSDNPVLVSGGFLSGASTDFNALLLASKIGIDIVWKLTDVDGVFTSDPDTDSSARLISDISWAKYLELFTGDGGIIHKPGSHLPIDLVGAKLAMDSGISVRVVNGHDTGMLRKIVSGRVSGGTSIGS